MKPYFIAILIFSLLTVAGCDDLLRHPFNQTYEINDIVSHPSRFEGVFYCRGIVIGTTDIFGFGRSYTLQDMNSNASIRVKTFRDVLPASSEILKIKCKLTEVFSFGDNKMLVLDELKE